MAYEWTCPFCDKGSIVTEANYYEDKTWFSLANAHGSRMFLLQFIVCPNPQCRQFTFSLSMSEYSSRTGRTIVGKQLDTWPLIPPSKAKPFPSYVPKPILDDYGEACLIRDLSPKASATLSRRCLQGLIRDFWKIRKDRLIDEIKELEKHIDPLTWKAIDAVRKVGNIGAHMEKDINVIVDVDPEEAAKLLGLIELLIRDWYIAREERKNRLAEIIEMGKAKQDVKQTPKQTRESETENVKGNQDEIA
jgi:Domain of unknown function (DUF4145)